MTERTDPYVYRISLKYSLKKENDFGKSFKCVSKD